VPGEARGGLEKQALFWQRLNSRAIPVIVTILDEAAVFATRILGTTDLPAVPYQVYVGFVAATCWNHFCHDAMGVLVGALFGQQAQATGDSEDVNVDGENRAITGKEQRASSSLWSDALEADQELKGLIKRDGTQEREVKGAAALVNPIQQLLDAT